MSWAFYGVSDVNMKACPTCIVCVSSTESSSNLRGSVAPLSETEYTPLAAIEESRGRLRFWLWSSYNNYSLDKKRIKRRPLEIDYVQLPDSYRG